MNPHTCDTIEKYKTKELKIITVDSRYEHLPGTHGIPTIDEINNKFYYLLTAHATQ